MEKIKLNGIIDTTINLYNKEIDILNFKGDNFTATDLALIFIEGNANDIKLIEDNPFVGKDFPKINIDEFIDKFILLAKKYHNNKNFSASRFLYNKISGYCGKRGWLFNLFFNEGDFEKIIVKLWEKINTDSELLDIDDFIHFYLDFKDYHKEIYKKYIDNKISSKWTLENIIRKIILPNTVDLDKQEIKTILKPYLLMISDGGLFGINNQLTEDIYANLSSYFSEDEILKLNSRFPSTFYKILSDKGISSNVLNGLLSNLLKEEIRFENQENIEKFANKLYNLLKFSKNIKLDDKSYLSVWKLLNSNINSETKLFNGKGDDYSNIRNLAPLFIENKFLPKSIIDEIVLGDNNFYKECISISNNLYISKEHIEKLLEVNNNNIIKNIIPKCSQFGIELTDLLGF